MGDHVHDGHRLRMKQRFLQNDLDSFAPHEVLELLLFFGVPRKDTNPLAHRLIDRFGGLSEVLEADYERLLEVDGVTENVATLLALMRPLLRRYQKDAASKVAHFNNSKELYKYTETLFFGEKNERMRLLCFNNRGDLLNCSVISEGAPDWTPLNTRGIVETALRYSSTRVLLAHSHPAGLPEPSDADIQNTIVIHRALDNVSIRLIDHLIVSPTGYVSMRHTERFSAAFSSYLLDDSVPDWLR